MYHIMQVFAVRYIAVTLASDVRQAPGNQRTSRRIDNVMKCFTSTPGTRNDVKVRIDMDDAEFQRGLFALEKDDAASVLETLRKLNRMTWQQLYVDKGMHWEQIHGEVAPDRTNRHTFRITRAFRAVAVREGDWLRILSLHPDHDSAYKQP